MKKHRNKKQKTKRKPPTGRDAKSNIHIFPSGRRIRVGELGVFDRSYPPKTERKNTIRFIKTIPEEQRSPDEWWMLGEYLVYDGVLEESDAITNEGIIALMKGANLPEPSIACLLDLAWVLAFKGLDCNGASLY